MTNNLLRNIGLSGRQSINEGYADKLLDYAQTFANCPWANTAVITVIDTAGLQILVSGSGQAKTVRIEFNDALTVPRRLRENLTRVVHQAENLLHSSPTW